jgi:queuine tRNA-ribosyltransferase
VFGIGQGGANADLRRKCARELVAMGFDGYAIGGVSVGEPEEVLYEAVRNGVAELPLERPRYLMGVGRMRQIIEAVAQGVDMFDCVMPTRYARNGSAFTAAGRFPVKAGEYKDDPRPIEDGCACYACRTFSRAYIRHLLNVKEILGARLLTVHNLHRYMVFMAEIRAAIAAGTFGELRQRWQCADIREET